MALHCRAADSTQPAAALWKSPGLFLPGGSLVHVPRCGPIPRCFNITAGGSRSSEQHAQQNSATFMASGIAAELKLTPV